MENQEKETIGLQIAKLAAAFFDPKIQDKDNCQAEIAKRIDEALFYASKPHKTDADIDLMINVYRAKAECMERLIVSFPDQKLEDKQHLQRQVAIYNRVVNDLNRVRANEYIEGI